MNQFAGAKTAGMIVNPRTQRDAFFQLHLHRNDGLEALPLVSLHKDRVLHAFDVLLNDERLGGKAAQQNVGLRLGQIMDYTNITRAPHRYGLPQNFPHTRVKVKPVKLRLV